MGYISYEEFLKLPSSLTSYIIAIRVAQSLKENREKRSDAKDQDTRKKLSDNIHKLEGFFHE